jgi:hypothetical protein
VIGKAMCSVIAKIMSEIADVLTLAITTTACAVWGPDVPDPEGTHPNSSSRWWWWSRVDIITLFGSLSSYTR